MRPVAHLANLDLNLLVALRELMRERSVTRAAQRLGVTQPAASAALSRLRRHFGDELLVREHGEYVLTSLGEQLAGQVEAVCSAAERLFAASTDFDPATSDREFTLVMADYTIMVMGEALSHALARAAPRARLHIRLVRESLATEYAEGIRFVDGMVAPPSNGFSLPDTRSAELFIDRWVCVVDADNPVLDGGHALRLRDLAGLPWVAPYYRSGQRGVPSVPVMRQLAALDLQPPIAVRVESYLAVPYFVVGTDRVALMQERLASRLATTASLRVLECPGDAEPIVEALWWHRQYEDDTAHAWLRRLIMETARKLLAKRNRRNRKQQVTGVTGECNKSGLYRIAQGFLCLRGCYGFNVPDMPHELTELRLDAVTRPASGSVHEISADVCVVGAGIAGSTAAIESARLGRSVVLIDSLPLIGGQMVHSLIGLFCGVFGNAPEYVQLTHGVFDDIFAALEPSGDLYFSRGHTTTVFYNEVALGRWLERTVRSLGIQVITGAVLGDVAISDGVVTSADFATRYGDVRVRASGYVDASGDAALAWQAGLPCWEPSRPIYGSQQFIVENLHEAYKPEAGEIDAVFAARGEEAGLLRRGGLAFFFPGRGTAVMNVTHIDAPLDPVSASRAMFEGRDQADRALELLRAEFPTAFGEARVRAYGFPGRRQTRWIKGVHQLSVDEVRSGAAFDDAVARTAWPVELHDRSDGYVWEMFPADHVHYVPLRSLLPPAAHNLVAAGRCIDGDAAALSSVRVMGPCSAMGAAAAHALDLARSDAGAGAAGSGGAGRPAGSVHDIDVGRLRERLGANLGSPGGA